MPEAPLYRTADGHWRVPDWTDTDLEREALTEPCEHFYRTDWLDEQTCGCGEVVFP